MSVFKKGFVFALLFILVFTSMGSVLAETPTQDKAADLNKLSVLQGDGVSFNLTSQLSRAEALTFIVRIMGQETTVSSNKEKYATTPYSDVKKTDWFAPIVGYGYEQKIISGFPDGKFHPNDKISEKAFLKLILVALGHSYDLDFNWTTVYAYSAQIGLIDSSNQNKTQDNLQYKREEVVNMLTTSLSLSNKLTNKRIIDLLDPNHTMLPAYAPTPTPTPTPKPDTLVTAVSSISVSGETNVTITFNEAISALQLADIIIYETGTKEKMLKISNIVINNNVVTLVTTAQKGNQSYVIEINNVVDIEEHTVAVLSSNFTGYVNSEIKSDLFKISKIETVSKNMINLFFTQPINGNIELPNYYEILKDGNSYVKGSFNGLTVKTLSGTNNAVTLLLKNEFISTSANYTLKVNGALTSIYGVSLNDGNGDIASFKANVSENMPFSVVEVRPMDDKTIKVTFNQEVDSVTIQQLSNYAIINSNNVPSSVIRVVKSGDGDLQGKELYLILASPMDTTKNYVLTLKNISNKLNQTTISESKYPYTGQGVTVRKDLMVVNVTPEDNQTLIVFVDRKLDGSSANNLIYYSLMGVTNPSYIGTISKVYYNPTTNPYQIKVYLTSGSSLNAGETYKLQILSPMQDEFGNTSLSNASTDFIGNNIAYFKPVIYEAMVIGKNTIRFHTSKEITNQGSNTLPSNYMLEYKDTSGNIVSKFASSVSLIDGQTGILNFENLDLSKAYTLRFISLTDYANLNTRVSSDGLTSIAVSVGH